MIHKVTHFFTQILNEWMSCSSLIKPFRYLQYISGEHFSRYFYCSVLNFSWLLYENHFFISKFRQWTIFGSLLDLLARELHKHFFLASLSMRPPIPLGRTFLTIHKYSHGKQNILHGITQNLYKNNTQNWWIGKFSLKQTKKLWLFDGTKHIKLRTVCEQMYVCISTENNRNKKKKWQIQRV